MHLGQLEVGDHGDVPRQVEAVHHARPVALLHGPHVHLGVTEYRPVGRDPRAAQSVLDNGRYVEWTRVDVHVVDAAVLLGGVLRQWARRVLTPRFGVGGVTEHAVKCNIALNTNVVLSFSGI